MHAKTPPSPTDRHIAKKLRDLRQRHNLTARQLDALIDEPPGTVARLERGARRIYTNHLVQIGAALNVEPASFFDGLPDSADSRLEALCREGLRLSTAFHAIGDNATRSELLDLIKTIADDPKFSET